MGARAPSGRLSPARRTTTSGSEEAGFRVLAFERDVPLVAAVDEYVLGGDARAEGVFTMTNVYPRHEANPLPDDAIEHVLHEAGIPMCTLDLREAHAAFRAIRNTRLIGFVGGFEELEGTPMADAYDAIIHVDRATAAVPLPWSATEIAARQT